MHLLEKDKRRLEAIAIRSGLPLDWSRSGAPSPTMGTGLDASGILPAKPSGGWNRLRIHASRFSYRASRLQDGAFSFWTKKIV